MIPDFDSTTSTFSSLLESDYHGKESSFNSYLTILSMPCDHKGHSGAVTTVTCACTVGPLLQRARTHTREKHRASLEEARGDPFRFWLGVVGAPGKFFLWTKCCQKVGMTPCLGLSSNLSTGRQIRVRLMLTW